MRSFQATCFLVTLLAFPANGQTPDPSRLTLDRIFASGDFRAGFERSPHWIDAKSYAQLEPSTLHKGFHDLVRVDPLTDAKTPIVTAEKLIPATAKSPLRIDDYTFSKDQDLLLLFTNSARVWRRNTRGDYWTYRLSTGKLTRVGDNPKPSSLFFAKLSPDGTRVGYVRDNNLFVEPAGGGTAVRLTSDGKVGGDDEIINGTFDWVYEEEFDCRDGWLWSPDSQRIAYWQINTLGVPRFTLVDQTAGKYPRLTTFPYPKTGEQNSLCRVGVVPVSGGQTTWMQVPGDTRTEGYIPRMDWAESPEVLVLQRLNRLQNQNQVLLASASTGQVKTILTEKDHTWVEVHDESMQWLDGGKSFTWISERDGWQHLYRVSRDGTSSRLITSGAFDVKSVLRVDEKKGWVYFLASPGKPTEQYLFRCQLSPPADGAPPPERLTPADQTGWNDYRVNPDGDQAVWTHSSFGVPPSTSLMNLDGHRVIRPINANIKLKETVARLARSPVEWFQTTIGDGLTMDGWLIKPPDFDPNKRYPLLIHVYGEPAGQTVADRWGGSNYLWHLYLAQQGYLVASMDNRGTKTPKGRAWRKSIYRKIGVHASNDQATGARELARRPYVDAGKLAVWGWSGGGSMTLNLLFRFPELYATGMSVAPVPDMSLYDTIYQERYMGLPGPNAADYKAGSPLSHASGLKGNLLLVHGTGDDNCHYQGTEKLMEVLVADNKPFTLMPYPNRSHSINEGKNTTRHLYQLMTRYLNEKTAPGGR
ncbi:MAG: DPP IV N-terminal domain-containing protein [Planctomycetota bacterium]|nr:DPP IV N-terminal domain-containing protein [Planctomycetota bacterium]